MVWRSSGRDLSVVGPGDGTPGDRSLVHGAVAADPPAALGAPGVRDEEMLAAHTLVVRRDKPGWLMAQPGWLEGVLDTLDWAWRHTRERPPIDMNDLRAG